MKAVTISQFSELRFDDVVLHLERDAPAEPAKNWLRALHYAIHAGSERVGTIDLRLGYTTSLVLYGGHIGYGVEPPHRGRHFAGKACRALAPLAAAFGLDTLWITCNPDNWASRRTCEYAGATLVEVVDLPPESDMYLEGDRQKCRYRWILY
ncbi:MAG TPA: GNAT family N-acetyltransferase [Polyangiaceae bacterium]|jgi:tagatose 1,6-diphosphate aldolase|nr:GNAT family N-acetyltransferase [Polyangiaceae bacterium]